MSSYLDLILLIVNSVGFVYNILKQSVICFEIAKLLKSFGKISKIGFQQYYAVILYLVSLTLSYLDFKEKVLIFSF